MTNGPAYAPNQYRVIRDENGHYRVQRKLRSPTVESNDKWEDYTTYCLSYDVEEVLWFRKEHRAIRWIKKRVEMERRMWEREHNPVVVWGPYP